MSDETCGAFHWASVKYPARDMVGVRDNPMIAIIDEVARRAGLRYIVNTVLDARNRIVRVVAGDPVAAHREGCRGRAVSRRGRRDPLIRARRPAAGGRREVSPPFSPWERQLSVLSAERRA